MPLTQEDLESLIKGVQDNYTLMGTTLCDEKQQENNKIKANPCYGCISRVPCILKNVIREINEFNFISSIILGKNISIRDVSPYLILLIELLLAKKGV